MYQHNGDKYFVVDGHTHFWDASPRELGQGTGAVRQGLDRVLPRLHGSRSAETHWPLQKFMKYSEEDFVKDVFEDAGIDVAIRQSTYLKEWYTRRLQHDRAQRRARREASGQGDRQWPLGSARGRRGAEAARGGRQAVQPQGRQGLHRRVVSRLARLDARRRGMQAVLREVQGARDQEHPCSQGPDDLAARQGRVRRQGHRRRGDHAIPSSTSSSSTSACRGSRTSASWRRRSRTSTPASRS